MNLEELSVAQLEVLKLELEHFKTTRLHDTYQQVIRGEGRLLFDVIVNQPITSIEDFFTRESAIGQARGKQAQLTVFEDLYDDIKAELTAKQQSK